MGDTGSLFLGFIISVIALLGFKTATITSLIIPLLTLFVPIIDTFFAMCRRILKGERIDGDKATVTVEITVYDYYKTNKEAGEYFSSNSKEFIDSKGDIDLSKFLKYKINKLLDTTDKVSYTLDLNLNKNNNKWEIEPLTNEQLTKLHGTYEY